MNNSSSNFSLEYREYILPDEFPVLVLAPKNVNRQSSFEDSLTKYHFHNCIEIGICHSGEHNLLFEDSVYKISPGMPVHTGGFTITLLFSFPRSGGQPRCPCRG